MVIQSITSITNGRPPLVLIADDDPANRRLLGALLRRAGCSVEEAADGGAAVDMAVAKGPDLILLDVVMPVQDGVAATRELRARPETRNTPIILVTGQGQSSEKVAGLDAGATDYVTKPFDGAELLARTRAALRTKAAFDRLEDTQAVLVALANAVEAKDPITEHHCNRLAGMALDMATWCDLRGEVLEAVGYAAALHDVGKIGVAEAILRKPAALTEDEWVEMRKHPLIGAAIVRPLRLGRVLAPIVRGHHERWDGRGYPDHLVGGDIPLGARIIGVVDSFDAITHDRPYRPGRTIEEGIAELRAGAGSQFDPALVDLFLSHFGDVTADDDGDERTRGLRLRVAAEVGVIAAGT
ncbi:MAG TPA: HD domain-containing phosphohydrolase [Candidatus Limnocylindrales bacterium]